MELYQEKLDSKSVEETLFNKPKESKKNGKNVEKPQKPPSKTIKKKEDKVESQMKMSSGKNPVAEILFNDTETKYDRPTIENMKKYFKDQNF